MERQYIFTFPLLLLLLCQGCSSSKKEYENILIQQQASLQSIQLSYDYNIKIHSCDDMINVLNEYLKKYPQDEWSDIARTNLQSWQSQKTTIISELNSLVNELSTRLNNRAVVEAKSKHEMSDIESIEILSKDQQTVGNRILITNVYAIRMKGAIFGIHIFKLKVTTSGYIATDSKTVVVNDRVEVEE